MSIVKIENQNMVGKGEKFSLLRWKNAISSHIFNEFGGKFKENYWKLGQIGQNT